MTRLLLLIIVSTLFQPTFSQDAVEKAMEKRAREMHRVIGLNDKDQWKKFIKENYTQQLIDKPMQANVQTADNGSASSEVKSADNIDAKAELFKRLHNDFADSQIASIKTKGETLEMVLKGGMITGTFRLTFEKNKPYRIDGIGIEAGN